jgi:hypothetical protein
MFNFLDKGEVKPESGETGVRLAKGGRAMLGR